MLDLNGKTLKSYQVAEMIGMGAFGAVYRAHQAVIEREVAIKVIWPAFANHPNFIRRFEAEAQLVAGLEHPHIVPLYDYWREPEGAYIVMRWLRGGALRSAMEQAWMADDVARILNQIAAALTLAHRSGVVHRDLKPENILMDEEKNAYLADFGIAQILSAAKDEDDEFGSMGSPAYAAPEQITGDPIEARTDIYSLGVILFELLTGQHPFPELSNYSQTQLVYVRTTQPLPNLNNFRPDLPPALDEVLQKATALRPQDRYPDAASLARSFREALNPARAISQTGRMRITTMEGEMIPNPYKGLRAFQESDNQNFFGRDELIGRLVDRLRENHRFARFLAVVGPSGSGKSSVVKAGLVPRLRQGALKGSDDWYYSQMVPGSDPFQELASELRGLAANPPQNLLDLLKSKPQGFAEALNNILPEAQDQLLLVIDQFEEVFTLSDNEAEAMAFVDSLYNAVTAPHSRVWLVITLRADFYDRPLKRPQISELMRERTEVVIPLTARELEQAIINPAMRVGVEVDPTLTGAIVNEVSEQLGALPLLQYTLSELFEHRAGNLLTLEAYHQLGGVRGSLARRADELYQSFGQVQQEIARQLFLRLITLGEGTEDTRRRALLGEVNSIRPEEPQVLRGVIERLGASRLLTFDHDPISRQPTVEVTHEAIIREWGRLRMWLDESRTDVRMQRALANLAQEWENNQQETSFLLRGIRLDQYEKWHQSTNLALSKAELDYLHASLEEHRRRQNEEKAQQERVRQLELRSVNRLRLLVGALLIGLMTALALTGFAFRESQSAQRERERTLDALKLSLSASQGLRASQAQSNNDGDLAIVLALAANEVPSPAIETQRILAEVALAPGTRRLMAGHTSFVLGVDLSPDKQFIVSASRDAKILLWNAETGALVREFERQHQGDITSVAFSPNGQYVVSTALDRYAILWDVATGAEIRRFVGHSDNTLSANFNPDGTLLATGGKDNLVIIWDVATGQEIKRFEGHTSRVPFVHFTPDGLHILSSSTEALLWKVDTLEIMQRFSLEGTAIRTTSLSNDGQQVAAGTTTGRLVIWETQTGNLVWESIEPDRLGIESLRFLPGGNELAVGISTGVIEIWDIPQNRIHYRLNGHQNIVSSLAASADGRFLVSGSVDTTVRLWNTSQASAMQTLRAHERKITGLASSPDGQRLYTTSEDGVLIAWGRADMTADPWLRSEEALIGLALSQSGALLLTANNEGQAYLLDTSTGQLLAEQVFAEGRVQSLALSPNGEWAALAFGGEPGKIILWNVNREGEILPFEFEGSQILDIDFSPDGRFLLIGGESLAQAPSLFSFELSSQSQSQIWAGADFETGFYALDISPDGSLLAAAGQNGLTYLWDFNSGQARGELRGHTDERLLDVSFSPDSRLLLSSANDKQVIIWDVAARDELQRFESSNAPQHPIFSPDGLQIWVGLNNGQLEQWQRFPLAELRAWAQENRYLRELSCGEREFYRVEPLCP